MLDRSLLVISRVLTLLLHWYLVVLEVILGLGFVLLLFGANPSSAFTAWVYRSLQQAMSPFDGMFQQVSLGTNGQVESVVDVSILFAMVVYGLFLVVVDRVLEYLTRSVRKANFSREMDRQDEAYAEAGGTYQTAPPNVIGDASTAGATVQTAAAPQGGRS